MDKHQKVTPYGESGTSKSNQVEQMFDNIAPRYDFLNHLLSMGIDKLWRKKVVKMLSKNKPKIILDVATGTGDFALECLKLNPDKIIGVDLSEQMLSFGRDKIKKKGFLDKIILEKGDSQNLQYQDNTFDAITVGFGVRNFENLDAGLKEMYRVLKPGGTLAVLEFSKPKVFPVKQLFNFYFHLVLPLIGKWFSKDERAYSYLPESVKTFPDGQEFILRLIKAGFKTTECKRLTFGISSIYTGLK